MQPVLLPSGLISFSPSAEVVSIDLIQNRRPFKCDSCNKTFKNPQTMKMHRRTHAEESHLSSGGGGGVGRFNAAGAQNLSTFKAGHNKKIPSKCPACMKTFVGLYELRRHYGRKHSTGEKQFMCKKCPKKFYIDVDLRDHEKLCGESVGCKCGMKFAFKCNLVAHKKAHPQCQDRFPVDAPQHQNQLLQHQAFLGQFSSSCSPSSLGSTASVATTATAVPIVDVEGATSEQFSDVSPQIWDDLSSPPDFSNYVFPSADEIFMSPDRSQQSMTIRPLSSTRLQPLILSSSF